MSDDIEECEILELAHYTVGEYLYSDRIKSGPVSRFSLSGSSARRTFAAVVLDVACQVTKRVRDCDYDNHGNFSPYCLTVSINLLRICERGALGDIQLQNLYYYFLDPSRAYLHC